MFVDARRKREHLRGVKAGVGTADPPEGADDIHSSQRTMILVRWVALPFALFQVLAYERPYPPGGKNFGLALVAILGVGNLSIKLWHRRPEAVRHASSIAAAGLILDGFVLIGFVWLYTFDPSSALWAILFILPLEGAVSFGLRGAISAWTVTAVLYTIREVWGSGRFDYPLEINSITFRMGIGGIIALVAGLMARNLMQQRQQLRLALAELKRIDRLRLGLLSALGHDVRSPLTVIRGSISTVLRRRETLTATQTQEMLSAADRHARRLETLANDLLDLARLEEGRLDLRIEDISLSEVLDKTLSYVDTEDVEVTVEPALTLRADSRRLEQVVFNLLANARRHGKPPIKLTGCRQGDQIRLDVCDNGQGVSPQEQGLLFEAFRSETEDGSVGYGLAIVKALTEAQGGEVSYQDAEPHGACFTVLLPAGRSSVASGPALGAQRESAGPMGQATLL